MKKGNPMVVAMLNGVYNGGLTSMLFNGGIKSKSDWASDPERLIKAEEKRKRKLNRNKGI